MLRNHYSLTINDLSTDNVLAETLNSWFKEDLESQAVAGQHAMKTGDHVALRLVNIVQFIARENSSLG